MSDRIYPINIVLHDGDFELESCCFLTLHCELWTNLVSTQEGRKLEFFVKTYFTVHVTIVQRLCCLVYMSTCSLHL